jgi:hypothetical protein
VTEFGKVTETIFVSAKEVSPMTSKPLEKVTDVNEDLENALGPIIFNEFGKEIVVSLVDANAASPISTKEVGKEIEVRFEDKNARPFIFVMLFGSDKLLKFVPANVYPSILVTEFGNVTLCRPDMQTLNLYLYYCVWIYGN